MSDPPYNNLYHIMGHTYGTWLPGDPRGFRTRHHCEHCEGDYKNPPPKGTHDELFNRSKNLMKRDPVYLTPQQIKIALDAVVTSLLKRQIPITVAALDRIHLHILAQFPDHNPRHWVGVAKKESSHALKLASCGIEGGIWAVRCECLPVTDISHSENAADYIAKHSKRGATIWLPAQP